MFTNPSRPPSPRSPEAHLEGFGVLVMLKVRKRIIVRLGEYDYDEAKRGAFADWMILRMAENRLRDGKQMDSIIAASYKAFLPQLLAQALKQTKA